MKNVQVVTALVTLATGIVLAFISFFRPPGGENCGLGAQLLCPDPDVRWFGIRTEIVGGSSSAEIAGQME